MYILKEIEYFSLYSYIERLDIFSSRLSLVTTEPSAYPTNSSSENALKSHEVSEEINVKTNTNNFLFFINIAPLIYLYNSGILHKFEPQFKKYYFIY